MAIVFFPLPFFPLTFLSRRSLSAVSNYFYLLFFLHSSPPSQFQVSFLGICSLCQLFMSHFYHMTRPRTPHKCLLSTFLNSIVHSYLILSSLASSLNSYDYSYQVVFRKSGPFSVVSLLMPSSQVQLTDMRLSSIICISEYMYSQKCQNLVVVIFNELMFETKNI